MAPPVGRPPAELTLEIAKRPWSRSRVSMCMRIAWLFGLSRQTTKKHLTRSTSIYSQFLGRSRLPGNPGRFSSRTAFPKLKSAQRGSNVARASLDEIVSGSVTERSADRDSSKMQRAPGQHDDLTRVPRTSSRAGRRGRSFATRHWRRATSRCTARMEPAVRSPWIESAVIADRARNGAPSASQDSKNSRQPTHIGRQTLARGTEFLDAETGG
jgi:hypothetical protein